MTELYELQLKVDPDRPLEGSDTPDTGLVNLILHDPAQNSWRVGVARLPEGDERLPELNLRVDTFVKDFLESGDAYPRDALAFGRLLLDRFLADPKIRELWGEAQNRRAHLGRPLRLEIILPSNSIEKLADLPLELLADEKGFLFRRPGFTLVRSIDGFQETREGLQPGDRAGFFWANTPQSYGLLPDEIFHEHEKNLTGLAESVGLEALPACKHATQESLKTYLREHAPIRLISLIAHGRPGGGVIDLHGEEGGVTLLPARDLAKLLKDAGTRIALLWSCHGGLHHGFYGAVAQALLDPDYGDLDAVLASHAALRAAATPRLLGALLQAWAGAAGGSLETAVSEARHALGEEDLQWAALVYYARQPGLKRPRVEAEPGPIVVGVVLEGAPPLAAYFRGRAEAMRETAFDLRDSRLVTIEGPPGIGKSELSLAVVKRVLQTGEPPLDRARWFSLTEMRHTDDLRGQLALAFGLEKVESDHQLARHIGETRALLVLDNAEDLIRSDRQGFRRLLLTLLRESGVRFLLSSREKLGNLEGYPETRQLLGRLPSPEDLEAFIAAAGPRLREDEKTSDALADLVADLDGHPLSLVLVASQVGRGLSLSGIRKRIAGSARNVRDFEIPAGDLSAGRRESLESSLALSLEPLRAHSPLAYEMFCWLGVLPAGLPAHLLLEVFGEGSFDALAVLQRSNLVEVREPHQRVGLLAPIRVAAREQLEGIEAELRIRLAVATVHILAAWLKRAYDSLKRGESRQAIEMAQTETSNLGALMNAIVSWPQAAATVEGFEGAIFDWGQILSYAGQDTVSIELAQSVLTSITNSTDYYSHALLNQLLGTLYVKTDRLQEAEKALDKALHLFRQVEDRLGEANTLRAIGDLYVRDDRLHDGELAYKKALPHYQQTENRLGEANTFQAFGDLYLRQDRLEEAEDAYETAIALFRQIEHRLGEANTLKGLGDLQYRQGRLQAAKSTYDWALHLFQ